MLLSCPWFLFSLSFFFLHVLSCHGAGYSLRTPFFFFNEEECGFCMKVPGIFGISSIDRSSRCSAPGELEQFELSVVAIRYQRCRAVFLMFVPPPISFSTEVVTEEPNSSSPLHVWHFGKCWYTTIVEALRLYAYLEREQVQRNLMFLKDQWIHASLKDPWIVSKVTQN